MRPHLLGFFFVTIVMSACRGHAGDDEKDASAFTDPDQADAWPQSFTPLGMINYEEPVAGRFVRDSQFDAYTFTAAEGAIVTLDNTPLGSTGELDSIMAIYGPRTQEGSFDDLLATDDDGGFGLHARIADFLVPATSEYLVVLGTYLGRDRGPYGLTLTCESDTCLPEVELAPVAISTDKIGIAEDGTTQTFELTLTQEPKEEVLIWLEVDNLDEALVYPTKLYFCPKELVLSNTGCTSNRERASGADGTWSRTVSVRVTGVRDKVDDGDVPFSVNLRVRSDDSNYAGLSIPIEGVNEDRPGLENGYSDLADLHDEELLIALHKRIGGHQGFGYQGINSARTLLFGTIGVFDGQVESIYTGALIPAPKDSTAAFALDFNTEHSWPQSEFDGLEPMVSDLHHIFAADVASNHSRASFGYGYSKDPEHPKSGVGASLSDDRDKVYQVRPERRGDIARAHFYMVARYAFDDTIAIAFDDDGRTDNGRIEDLEEAVLREWNRQDPVDAWERRRHERIVAAQGNRNPFIDQPELADRIADF